jgi:hypothetical protein
LPVGFGGVGLIKSIGAALAPVGLNIIYNAKAPNPANNNVLVVLFIF